MSSKRTFQIYDQVFWGFRAEIDLCGITDLKTIVDIMKGDLANFLLKRNLQDLAEKALGLTLHLHGHTCAVNQLLHRSHPNETVYLCSCANHSTCCS